MAGQGNGGAPPFSGAPGAFDFSSIQSVLNDPSIQSMAQQISGDPAFQEMTKALQESMKDVINPMLAAQAAQASQNSSQTGLGGASDSAESDTTKDSARSSDTKVGADGKSVRPDSSSALPTGMPGMPGMPGIPPEMAAMMGGMPGGADGAFDPAKYYGAMNKVLQNPQFMQMAERLGQQIMQQDPSVAAMMQTMTDPSMRDNVAGRMEQLKEDPELGPILEDIEKNGPPAMMKYWNDPDVLAKLGGAMQGAFGQGEEEEEEEEEEPNVHNTASAGDHEALRTLLEGGADKDAQDEEGRTALHFACGYGEIKCAEVLLEFKANVDLEDNNKNSAMHYAAGYGMAECVELLLKSGANTSTKNLDGKTPLEVAELNSQDAVAAVLKQSVAEAASK